MDSSFTNPGAGNNSINVKNELPNYNGYDCVHAKVVTRQKAQVGLCVFNAIMAFINCAMVAFMLSSQTANRNHIHDILVMTREHVIGTQDRMAGLSNKINARMEQLYYNERALDQRR